MTPLIITAALVGAETSRAAQPALPLSPREIAAAAADCVAAGASIVHLHARRADGSPTQDVAVYQEIIDEIECRTDVVIQLSTGGAVGMSAAERIAPVRLKPAMASLTLGSVNFGDELFANSLADIRHFAQTIASHGVKPELEIFDSGMLATAQRGIAEGWLRHDDRSKAHFGFVLGVKGGMPATVESLVYLKSQLPQGASWSVAAMGAAQLAMSSLAIVVGGHARVGFEDNIYFKKGELATSNAQLVERIAKLAQIHDRPVASPQQARQILGLSEPR